MKKRGFADKLIEYEELQKLHKEYGNGMLEKDFAQTILGLSYSSYLNCKNSGTRAKVFKNKRIELPEERIQEIIKELTEKGYIGKTITYEELQKLHEEYGNGMLEKNFAQIILGCSHANYWTCRCQHTNIIVKNGIVNDKAKEISALYFSRTGYYSKEFIDNICEEYGITIEEFITYVVIKRFYDNVTPVIMNAVENNKGLWIGKTRLSEEFTDKNISLIQEIAINIANWLCTKYRIKQDKQDYIQDIIIYIITNMGAEEKNFGDNLELFQNIIYMRARKHCEGMILKKLKVTSKEGGFTRLSRKGKTANEQFETQIRDENCDVEKKILQSEGQSKSIEESERCIKLLSQYLEEGYNRSEAIAMTAEQLDVDASTMLEYMKEYLVIKGKVKVTRKGNVEWETK